MSSRHLIHRVVSEKGAGIPAIGYFLNDVFVLLRHQDDHVTRCMARLLATGIGGEIRSRLRSAPAGTGLQEVALPFGISVAHYALDRIICQRAGIFVVKTIRAPSFDIASSDLAFSVNRKQKKRLKGLLSEIGDWQNPKGSQLSRVIAAIVHALKKSFEEHSAEAFSRALTSYQDFVSSFSHEALSPIQEIRTSLELTLRQSELTAPTRGRLESSLQALDDLRVALEGMRLLFREDEKRPLANQFRSIDLREIVGRWTDFHMRQFDDKNIEVIQEPRLTRWSLRCVPEYIEVLVRNLISNGVKYSFDASGYETPGKFLVRFDHARGQLSFVNFGVPIPEEEIKSGRLFTSGHRGQTADDRGRVGKGIGLHLVKRIVDLHGGDCTVKSEIQNRGGEHEFARTEFIISFPNARGGIAV